MSEDALLDIILSRVFNKNIFKESEICKKAGAILKTAVFYHVSLHYLIKLKHFKQKITWWKNYTVEQKFNRWKIVKSITTTGERLFRPDKLRPDNEMLSEARKFVY